MAGLTDAAETLVLQWLFNQGTPTRPSAVYVGLFTTTPTADDGTGGTEVSGGSYAREAITASVSGNTMNPSADVTFTTATASWGTVNGFGLFDAVSGGNLLAYDDVTTPKLVDNGDTAKFTAANLSVTMD